MAQLKNLLEKDELKHMKEVKENLIEETSVRGNSGKVSKVWFFVAAIIPAVVYIK